MLQNALFGKGLSHLGHTQHSGSPQHRSALRVVAVATTAAHHRVYLGIGRDGARSRGWLAPWSLWGSDVWDNLKSPSLCDLA